jgi:hypothetical protein
MEGRIKHAGITFTDLSDGGVRGDRVDDTPLKVTRKATERV